MGEYTEKQGEEVLTAQNATLRIYPEEIAGQLFRVDVDCPDECFDRPKHWVICFVPSGASTCFGI